MFEDSRGKKKKFNIQAISLKKFLFLVLLFFTALPFIKTHIALLAGISFSLVFGNPYQKKSSQWSKRLLKLSVIGLGFGLSLQQVWVTGKSALIITVVSISGTLLLGKMLGNIYKTSPNISTLVSFGTAICGGSAIAALAPVLKSKDEEVAVSLATVFTLNSIALLLFPYIGHLFKLSQEAFGLWAALAIHDTSSVVGASALYGSTALAIGTTVKLTRALWIIPFSLGFALVKGTDGKLDLPFFIFGFIGAATLASLLPQFSPLWLVLNTLAKQALVVTLFLIGSGLTKQTLKQIGLRPLAQGVTLWILVSVITLALILYLG